MARFVLNDEMVFIVFGSCLLLFLCRKWISGAWPAALNLNRHLPEICIHVESPRWDLLGKYYLGGKCWRRLVWIWIFVGRAPMLTEPTVDGFNVRGPMFQNFQSWSRVQIKVSAVVVWSLYAIIRSTFFFYSETIKFAYFNCQRWRHFEYFYFLEIWDF